MIRQDICPLINKDLSYAEIDLQGIDLDIEIPQNGIIFRSIVG